MVRTPTATYRLQLRPDFGFREALGVVDYLKTLGISDVYVSPILAATPGSTHGYDVVDAGRVNPELGGEEGLEAFSAELRARGMGLIVDFVPNHMGVASNLNQWWNEVLESGPNSIYADYFDIDWLPPKESLAHKLLLPVLGDQYGLVLERGEIQLVRDEGRFFFRYGDRLFPLAPRTLIPLLTDALRRLALPPEDDTVMELESIRTALEHLPSVADTEESKRVEGAREKEVIKRRLGALVAASPPVAKALDDAVAALAGTKGDPSSFDALDALLRAQPYRLCSWRLALEATNYRRFFDVNDLAAIRMEYPPVFQAMHVLLLRLVEAGQVTGIRLDHTDGLYDPTGYFESLAGAVATALGQDSMTASEPPIYTVAEKILAPGEPVPPAWKIHGTTGYDFARIATGVLVDGRAEAPISIFYRRFTGDALTFDEHVVAAKRQVMRQVLAAEIGMLARALERIAESRRNSRDFTVRSLETALVETLASFPVYRTYVRPDGSREPSDDAHVNLAVRAARRRNPGVDATIFAFVRDLLLLRGEMNTPFGQQLAMKVQQTTGPVMAKAVEDTVFFRFTRFIAENEVGSHPEHVGVGVDEFHRENETRAVRAPLGMTSTSTHDTKLGEDVRARLAVLSEMPGDFRHAVSRWSHMARPHRSEQDDAPARADEYRFYQALIGIFPWNSAAAEGPALASRLVPYAVKAAREAKQHTSWLNQDEGYERALSAFVEGVLGDARIMEDVRKFADGIACDAATNALAQVALKLTAPGVPDTYQGSELWHQVLVEPDNRGPVDYEPRRAVLRRVIDGGREREGLARELLEGYQDGAIKLYLVHRLLTVRGEMPDVFLRGAYERLSGGNHVVAFARVGRAGKVVTCVPRHPRKLTGGKGVFALGDVWGDERLRGGVLEDGETYEDVLTGRTFAAKDGVALSELFGVLPVAVLRRTV